MQSYDVLIVGAGQAAAQVAAALRQQGFAGSIGMVGEETDPPYERPPLSKAYLSGEVLAEQLALRPPSFWVDNRVNLMTGLRITRVDPTAHQASCDTGEVFEYSHLVWSAGGQPRPLTCEGAALKGVHVVRTRAHVDALRAEVADCKNIVIVGGGYIGLETAAVLAKAGKSVCVLEAMDRVLARVTSPAVSSFFEAEHRGHGVQVLTSAAVSALQGKQGRVSAVVLADGRVLPADLVVVGIGLIPEIAALAQAGAVCSNGVDIDAQCRTSLPDVYAIGDCANHVNAFANGQRVRLESVQNANDQAKVTAANIAGVPTNYHAVPWFWSNQYDLRLQTVGLSIGYDQYVVRGLPESRSFSVVYLREGQVIALDCINAARDFMNGKKLVAQKVSATEEQLADTKTDLGRIAATIGEKT